MTATLEDLNLTIKDLELTVRKHHAERGGGKFLVTDYDIKNLGEVPGGILCINYIISVKLREKRVTYHDLHYKDYDDDTSSSSESILEEDHTCSFFVKRFPQTEFSVKYAEDLNIFRKERKLYDQLIPRLQDVGLGHKPWSARCYYTKEDSVIVLENLNDEGYVKCDSTTLDLEHLQVTLKTLARMHGASIALEERRRSDIPKLYPNFLEENGYPAKDQEGYRQAGVKLMTKTILKLVGLMSPYYDDWDINEIIEAFPGVLNRIYELVKPSQKYRNVFNQSDLWASNILFKYEKKIQDCEDTKHPIDCRLIDFQFSRYAPPAFEIASLLIISSSREFRETHIKQLLDIYYEALDIELSVYGFVTEDILSRNDFYNSYEEYKIVGLVESLLFNQIIFLPVDFWTELTLSSEKFKEFILSRHTEICLEAFDNNEYYRTKVTELLRETIDLYVLKNEYNARL